MFLFLLNNNKYKMRGSPRKGRNRRDGADDDEETEDEREESEIVSVSKNVPNIYMYECGCGQRYIINSKKTNSLSNHKKKCNIDVKYPYSRDDDFNKIVNTYKMKRTKELVERFRVFKGTMNMIVDWLNDDGSNETQILNFFKEKTKIQENVVRQNLRDFYGRPLLDEFF